MPHATRSTRACVALVAAMTLALSACSHDGEKSAAAGKGRGRAIRGASVAPGARAFDRTASTRAAAQASSTGAMIAFRAPGHPEVRVPGLLIDGARFVSAMQLLGALGLEVTFRPSRGELSTRVGRKPLRILAGRSVIDYGGHAYHTAAAPRAAGDDLLLPEEFLGPLRAAFLESSDDPAAWAAAPAPGASALRTVVIDPGHGGANTGAKGPGGLLEKDLTLAVSERLARILREELKCRVVLTRETDRALSLPERTAIANRERADLFVSVHANASPSRVATGFETFILSATASDAESKRIADEENAAGGEADAAAAGFLDLTLQDLVRAESMEESARFAALVQRRLDGAMDSADRGVKQAPFWVLAGAEMPAVLVEIGFITNPSESRRLASPSTQERIARSVAGAISAFRDELDRRRGLAASATP